MVSYCRSCNQEITFDDFHVSKRTGKKKPLNPYTGQLHDCPVWRQQHIRHYDCRKGCGAKIFFDDRQKSKNGIPIPIDKRTGFPHQCPLTTEY
jgi:hypothetical protein